MKAQNVYGRKASRQYREVTTKYVPAATFSTVLSQSFKRCLSGATTNLNAKEAILDLRFQSAD